MLYCDVIFLSMIYSKSNSGELVSRRQFLTFSLANSLLYNTAFPSRDNILLIARLHPVRFLAGLIFDFIESVFVELAKDFVVNSLLGGNFPNDIRLSRTSGYERAGDFMHPNYIASNIILGVSDYEIYKSRKLRLTLNKVAQERRFGDIVSYLNSEKIRIKTNESEYSFLVGLDTDPNDFFMIDYFQMERNQHSHYKNLIEITQTEIFDELVV